MDQYKYIIYKPICLITWHVGTTQYNKENSQKIEDALNGIIDNLNLYNNDKNVFDLLFYCNHKTIVHVINLKEKTVLDMSTMKKYSLYK